MYNKNPNEGTTKIDQKEIDILLEKIDLNQSKLSGKTKAEIRKLVSKYPEAFVLSNGKIGKFTGVTTHHIPLLDEHTIPKARPYRMNPEQKEKLEKELHKMQADEHIEPSSSPYSSPLLIVPKKNGDIRIVIDYRKLNLITRPRTYIMPHTLDVTEEASKGKIFSVFDIASGFHHIRMNEDHKQRTAFCCHLGVFQYRVMPMGLKGSPDTFNQAMEEVKQKYSGSMIVYVDDIVLVSETEEQHVKDLEEFFQLMIKMGLKLKAEKSQIGRTRITFLGFDIENNTIQPNGEKTKAIREFPAPRNITEVKQFLGMCSYFRRFIPGYAILVNPINKLNKKGAEFEWKQEQQEAFEKVKEILMSPPILTTPDMTGTFEMHTDASKIGLSAVLMQKQADLLKVVAYASRPTTAVESRYPPIELEALAITWGLIHHKPYVFNRKVLVVTDHLPLKSLLHRKEKTMSGRLMRHEAIIQQFDVEIVYRPGKENYVADALSRQRVPDTQTEAVSAIRASKLSEQKNLWTFQTWKKIQIESCALMKIKEKLLSNRDDKETLKAKKKYLLINDVIHLKPKNNMEIPPVILEGGSETTNKLIMDIHQIESHGGPEKTRATISRFVVWKGMKDEIFRIVTTCQKCQRRKMIPTHQGSVPMGRWEIASGPFQRIHMDVIGPFPETTDGNKYIIAAIDSFSRFAVAKATTDQKATTSLQFLIENIVSIHGIPNQVVTDQGRNFTSKMFQEVSKLLELDHIQTPSYHHESNGVIERLNRTLEEMLTCSTKKPENFSDWDKKLPIVIHAYNSRIHKATGLAPEKIIFGRHTSSPLNLYVEVVQPQYHDQKDYADSLAEIISDFIETAREKSEVSRESYKTFYDKRHNVRDTNFQVGEKVLIQDFTAGKLEYQFSPPATVLKTTETTVTVRNHKNKVETIHKNRVKRHITLESIMKKQKDQQAAQNNDMEGQADETIVGQGMRGKPEGDEKMDSGVGSRRFVRRSRLHHESIRRSRRLQGLQPMADTLSQFPI
ncbi:hypothetical protein CAEBREN_31218 [Caenorhabditis brenneri]|uniref:RNA-directed DNA polymerase n=1 Tax=Caenorhabditis brenneri TaxID=135651 RepID=G0MFX3_CAEBE|nr:hypothetical protein CAEBREN_31218 [Caenorhabditis brenneri]